VFRVFKYTSFIRGLGEKKNWEFLRKKSFAGIYVLCFSLLFAFSLVSDLINALFQTNPTDCWFSFELIVMSRKHTKAASSVSLKGAIMVSMGFLASYSSICCFEEYALLVAVFAIRIFSYVVINMFVMVVGWVMFFSEVDT